MNKSKITAIISSIFILTLKFSGIVYAADKLNLPQDTNPQVMAMPSAFSLLMQLIISLIVILILVFYTLKFLRKNMQLKGNGNSIKVLDQQAFGLNKGVYVTEIGDKVYVLGVTEHNINLVTELTDQNLIQAMRSKAAQRELEPVVPAGLTSFLTNLFKTIKSNMNYSAPKGEKDFKTHIQAQVNKLQTMFKKGQEEDKDEEK